MTKARAENLESSNLSKVALPIDHSIFDDLSAVNRIALRER